MDIGVLFDEYEKQFGKRLVIQYGMSDEKMIRFADAITEAIRAGVPLDLKEWYGDGSVII